MTLTVRTWLRYVVPLTLLSAIALSPLLYIALTSPAATDVVRARAQLRLAWVLGSVAWMCQWWLVAGVAPAVRALARRERLSQWRALTTGLRSLLRGAIPCAIAIAAIAIGTLALVIPGLILLVLLAPIGASDELTKPPPAPHADAIAIARSQLSMFAWLVVGIIVLDLAIVYGAQELFLPALGKKPVAATLLPIRTLVRSVGIALVVISPLAACAIVTFYERFKRRTP